MGLISSLTDTVYKISQASKNSFKEILAFYAVRIYLLISLIINAFIWSIAYFILKNINEAQIALHYSVDIGIDYYGSIKKIFVLPLLGLMIIVFNFIILILLRAHEDKKFLISILGVAMILANIIIFVAAVSVYFVNSGNIIL